MPCPGRLIARHLELEHALASCIHPVTVTDHAFPTMHEPSCAVRSCSHPYFLGLRLQVEFSMMFAPDAVRPEA